MSEEIPTFRDPVARRLAIVAAALFIVTVCLFLFFGWGLDSGVDSLREAVENMPEMAGRG